MNKIRRKEICALIKQLNLITNQLTDEAISDMKVQIDIITCDVQLILQDEEFYKDNIPDNLQNGYRYMDSETACERLEDAISVLEEISDEMNLNKIISLIDEAIAQLENAL